MTKASEKRKKIHSDLNNELRQLRGLWHQEYKTLQKSIDNLNKRDLAIKVELVYRGDKPSFEEFLRNTVQGSGITGKKIKKVTEQYNDRPVFILI